MDYGERLKSCKTYDCVFELVKEVVKKDVGNVRRGMILFLAPLPVTIGAYHVVGTNTIVMNSIVMDALKELNIDDLRKNSYIFTILPHEYLHSLGIFSEREVRRRATEICRSNFGELYLTTKMSSNDPLRYIPEVINFISSNIERLKGEIISGRYRVVRDFDNEGARYFL
ncbi:MAG: hypothetical protein ACTSR0_00960 [Candidatus Asgardarchaeia archaeon]